MTTKPTMSRRSFLAATSGAALAAALPALVEAERIPCQLVLRAGEVVENRFLEVYEGIRIEGGLEPIVLRNCVIRRHGSSIRFEGGGGAEVVRNVLVTDDDRDPEAAVAYWCRVMGIDRTA